MSTEALRQEIRTFLQASNTLEVGFCSANNFEALRLPYLKRLEEGLACDLEVRDQIEAMIEPMLLFEAVKSFVVIAVPYAPYESDISKAYGRMASGCASLDYHSEIHDLFKPLQDLLKTTYKINSKVIVDTSPLSDRALAVRSGIGIIRRNGMCYNAQYGSYFYIGSLMIDYDLEALDIQGPANPCGNCRKCMDFCPNQAIQGDYSINSNLCVSYLSQKKILNEAESCAIGQQIYGCDVCQMVCPANAGLHNPIKELIVDYRVSPLSLLEISNKKFAETYKKTAAGWRGKRTLQRNAIAMLGNSGVKAYKELLEALLEDDRTIIKDEARRALKRLVEEES